MDGLLFTIGAVLFVGLLIWAWFDNTDDDGSGWA